MQAHYYRYVKWPSGMRPKSIVRLKDGSWVGRSGYGGVIYSPVRVYDQQYGYGNHTFLERETGG